MRLFSLLAVLLASVSFAQAAPGPNGGISRGNLLPVPQYRTSGTSGAVDNYYVNASTGSDSFNCTDSTTPCLTIQGAINKVPKRLRNQVTVTVAAGTYGCFVVAGFTCDASVQTATGGFFIDAFAAFTNSTLATGTATGTATASSAGSGTTYGTLTDGAQTWTVNDLRGRFVTAAGQTRVISSNTATGITIVGTWTNPGTVAYTIQDPGVTINTACSAPATPTLSASANSAAVIVNDNNCGQRAGTLAIRGVRLSNTSGQGVLWGSDPSGFDIIHSQLRTSTASALIVQAGAATNSGLVGTVGRLTLTDVDILNGVGATSVNHRNGLLLLTRVLARGGSTALSTNSFGGSVSVLTLDAQGNTLPVAMTGGVITSMTGAHIDCASTGTGLLAGSATDNQNSQPSSLVTTSVLISTCGTGVRVSGETSTADLIGVTGSAATTGISVVAGGSVTFPAASTTLTGGTQDISLDSGGVTAALADVGSCLQSSPSGSKICVR